MKIADHIRLAESRLAWLNTARSDAERVGDIARVTLLDAEIAETAATVAALRTLL